MDEHPIEWFQVVPSRWGMHVSLFNDEGNIVGSGFDRVDAWAAIGDALADYWELVGSDEPG